MTFTPNARGGAAPASSPDVTWPRMLRLGALGLASDIRDRQAGAEPAQAADGACARPPAAPADLHHRRPPVRYHVPGQLHRPDARGLVPPGAQADQGRRAVRVRRVVERAAQRRGLQDLLFGSAARRAGRRPPLRREKSREWLRGAVPGGALPAAQFVHIIRDGRDATVSHAEQPWLAAASGGTARRGRGGQLWGPYPRWWVEPDRREEFTAVSDLVRSAWCWRRFTTAALAGLAACRWPDARAPV